MLDGGLDRQLGFVADVGGVLAGRTLLLQQTLEPPEVGLDGGVLPAPLAPQPTDQEEEPDQQSETDEQHVGNDERRGVRRPRRARLLLSDTVDGRRHLDMGRHRAAPDRNLLGDAVVLDRAGAHIVDALLEAGVDESTIVACDDVADATSIALGRAGEADRIAIFGSFVTAKSALASPGTVTYMRVATCVTVP